MMGRTGAALSEDLRVLSTVRARQNKPHQEPASLPIGGEGVDVTSLLGIMDLRDDTCRWPHGDPLLAGFGFCGKPVKEGSSWCPDHHARVFIKGSGYGGGGQ